MNTQPQAAESAIVVFTSRTPERMLREGGSQAWTIGHAATAQSYIVCTWNSSGEFAQPNTGFSHGEAFLIAKISSITPSPEDRNRSIIRFHEYAHISIPDAWNKQRNPFTYTTLQELQIDPQRLKWVTATTPVPDDRPNADGNPAALTIEQAKKGLAETFGVHASAIEITIRA